MRCGLYVTVNSPIDVIFNENSETHTNETSREKERERDRPTDTQENRNAYKVKIHKMYYLHTRMSQFLCEFIFGINVFADDTLNRGSPRGCYWHRYLDIFIRIM